MLKTDTSDDPYMIHTCPFFCDHGKKGEKTCHNWVYPYEGKTYYCPHWQTWKRDMVVASDGTHTMSLKYYVSVLAEDGWIALYPESECPHYFFAELELSGGDGFVPG